MVGKPSSSTCSVTGQKNPPQRLSAPKPDVLLILNRDAPRAVRRIKFFVPAVGTGRDDRLNAARLWAGFPNARGPIMEPISKSLRQCQASSPCC